MKVFLLRTLYFSNRQHERPHVEMSLPNFYEIDIEPSHEPKKNIRCGTNNPTKLLSCLNIICAETAHNPKIDFNLIFKIFGCPVVWPVVRLFRSRMSSPLYLRHVRWNLPSDLVRLLKVVLIFFTLGFFTWSFHAGQTEWVLSPVVLGRNSSGTVLAPFWNRSGTVPEPYLNDSRTVPERS